MEFVIFVVNLIYVYYKEDFGIKVFMLYFMVYVKDVIEVLGVIIYKVNDLKINLGLIYIGDNLS